MSLLNLRRTRVTVLGVVFGALAACQAPGVQLGALTNSQSGDSPLSRPSAASGESVLFAFDGENGEYPTSGLTLSNAAGGTFYGTTPAGGSKNVGTAYRITARGSHHLLHDFKVGRHSFSPVGALTSLNGEFYGAAAANRRCRAHRAGTCAGAIFALDRSGQERVVYAFKGGRDGAQPVGALTVLNGALFGVTEYGGTYGLGTVFEVAASGAEKVLHSFVKADGLAPTGTLVSFNGKLYGTTNSGGAYSYGTVFSITPSGKEIVLHSFSGQPDGASPGAGLTPLNGTLYGTTISGGGGPGYYCDVNYGCGTVFSIDRSGHEKVIFKFRNALGSDPQASLTNVDGVLYGTTVSGGTHMCTRKRLCGTVFSIDTSGNETVVHDFSGPDGAFPYAGLIYSNGKLYGTTEYGGSGACSSYYGGCGTIFSVRLSKRGSE